MEASSTQSAEHKRTTDDTARLDVTSKIELVPASEGVSMLLDFERRMLKTQLSVVEQLASAKVEQLKRKAGVAVPAGDGSEIPPDNGPAAVTDGSESGTASQTDGEDDA